MEQTQAKSSLQSPSPDTLLFLKSLIGLTCFSSIERNPFLREYSDCNLPFFFFLIIICSGISSSWSEKILLVFKSYINEIQ